MSTKKPPVHGQTPPKGRPTRARNEPTGRGRVFGPATQWTLAVLLIAIVIVVIIVLTDGGDFNPFNQDQVGGAIGAITAGLGAFAPTGGSAG